MTGLPHIHSGSTFWKLAMFYATYFFVFGIYMPYWPLWLNDIGLTPVEIGWVLAGAFWIKVIVQPGVAHVADTTGRTKILTAVKTMNSKAKYAMKKRQQEKLDALKKKLNNKKDTNPDLKSNIITIINN